MVDRLVALGNNAFLRLFLSRYKRSFFQKMLLVISEFHLVKVMWRS